MDREVAKGVLSVLLPPRLPGPPSRRLCGCGHEWWSAQRLLECPADKCSERPARARQVLSTLTPLRLIALKRALEHAKRYTAGSPCGSQGRRKAEPATRLAGPRT